MRQTVTPHATRLVIALVLLLSALGIPNSAARASTYLVTIYADTQDNVCDSDCSIRDALYQANLTPGLDTIVLQEGTYALTQPSQLELSGALEIIGKGSDLTTISAAPAKRVLFNPFKNLTLKGLTISGGDADFGGGVYCLAGTLTLDDVAIVDNSALYSGGGLYLTDCSATIANSRITENYAGSSGGGINSSASTMLKIHLNITDTLIAFNTAVSDGGGIFASNTMVSIDGSRLLNNSGQRGGGYFQNEIRASLTLSNSLVASNNSSFNGGGLYLSGGEGAAIQNSTIARNSAVYYGGGIYTMISTTISNCTIAENTANTSHYYGVYGGGLLADSGALVTVSNTILANNQDGTPEGSGEADCTFMGSGAVASAGYNLVKTPGICLFNNIDKTGIDPLFNTYGGYGGQTYVFPLLPGSPAINAGDPNFTPPPDFDQRGPGFPRVLFGRLDIGAFEAGRAFYLPLVID